MVNLFLENNIFSFKPSYNIKNTKFMDFFSYQTIEIIL